FPLPASFVLERTPPVGGGSAVGIPGRAGMIGGNCRPRGRRGCWCKESPMRAWLGCCLGLAVAVAPVRAAEPNPRVVREHWDAAYLEGARSGYVHTVVRAVEKDGRKYLHATLELRLAVKRFNNDIQLRMETGDVETAEGKVTGVFMRQYLGKQQQLNLTGTV